MSDGQEWIEDGISSIFESQGPRWLVELGLGIYQASGHKTPLIQMIIDPSPFKLE
jgi:hypothetical protein